MLELLSRKKVKLRLRASAFIKRQSLPEYMDQLSSAVAFTTFQNGGRISAVTGIIVPWKLDSVVASREPENRKQTKRKIMLEVCQQVKEIVFV